MDNSKTLWKSFQNYHLLLGGKSIPSPYRTNLPYQMDTKKKGKSDPEELTKNVIEEAKEKGFDLESANADEIRIFMIQNLLGIDCSGYAYHSFDLLLKEIGKGGMRNVGFPEASKTNVKLLSSDDFSTPVERIDQIMPGDMITFKTGPGGHAHVMIIMEKPDGKIIYTHSTGLGKVKGIKQNTITITDPSKGLKEQDWDEVFANGTKRVDYFDPDSGDGVRRLKALQ